MRNICLAAAVAAALLGARLCAAQTDPKLAEYDAAFSEMISKPGDPASAVKYAQLAVEVGDMEGAVSALEGLLMQDADQPEVELELGVLYYRLGSTDAARAHLEAAGKSRQASAAIKTRASEYLKALR
jgi:thioredoxin-like negative regulator of GroEL